MKPLRILAVYFLFTVGCAPPYIQPSFEDSNQYFLEKTIDQLDVGKELEGRISPKYNIALLSIENNLTLDKPIIAMIEEQIISSLIDGGYTIVERDDDVIQNLISERKGIYSLTFNNPSENITYDKITGDALTPGISFMETQLSSAGILISYRILETGIVYYDIPDNKEYEKREAMVRLHIRVHKTRTGEIVHATNLTSTLSDTLRREIVNQLEAFHYSFFPYEYPLQENEEQKSALIIKSAKRKSIRKSNKKWNISTKIGGGANQVLWSNSIGIITGGSISYGKKNGGEIGADLMYIIAPKLHTMGLTGFYERNLFKYNTLRGGVSYLKTGYTIDIGGAAGAGLSFSIGKYFLIKPMAEVNFGSVQNNIVGVNMNLGFSF